MQYRDGFIAQGSGNDEFALTYYDRGDLGFIHEAARQYTLYDRYFTSLMSSTFPNRYYKWSAQSGGKTANVDQVDVEQGGNRWETIFDRAIANNLSARYYASDLPFAAVWGPRGIPAFSNHLSQFLEADRGSVLQREGSSRRYFYRFSDPILQPYVILNGLSEGSITDDQLRRFRARERAPGAIPGDHESNEPQQLF